MRWRTMPGFLPRAALATALVAAAPECMAGQADAVSRAPLTYDAALERALHASPRIAAARLRHAIGLASRDVASERLNPEFRVEIAKETPNENYSLAIPWELGGKRARRVAVASAALASIDAELAQVGADVQADVRRAFGARVVAEERLALVDDLRAIALRVREAAQARFEAGDVPRLDVVQARLALADVENQAVAARGAVASARAVLNALLGYPADAPTAIVRTVGDAVPITVGEAVSRARAANVELARVDRQIGEARARRALAISLRRPDVTPEITLTRGAAPEFDTGWRAALAFTLPVFSTHAAGVRVEDATLAGLEAERAAVEARLDGDVTAAALTTEAARQQYVRYREEIVPQAVEVERMAEDAYRLGQTGLASYLQALQTAREVRLRAIQAGGDLHAALADLDRAVGAPVLPRP